MGMINETKQKKRERKRNNSMKVVEIQHVQVPDMDERLSRVFKILMSSFEDKENHS